MKRNIWKLMIVLMLVICVLPMAAFAEGEPVHEHTWVHMSGFAATCTQPGKGDWEECSGCGAMGIGGAEIPSLGHYWVTTEAKAPTCTEAGYGNGESCQRCAQVNIPAPVISALGHDLVHVDGTSNVCQDGLSDGEKCQRAGCSYWSIPQTTVPAVHSEIVAIPGKASSCTETGLTEGSKCNACGMILKAQETIPLHTPQRVPGKAPTCKEKGMTDGTICSACKTVLVAQSEIAVVSCNWIHVPGYAATCTTVGKADAEMCSMCKAVSIGGQTIPALGHIWNAPVETRKPSCGVEGLLTYTCGRDASHTKTDKIPATGKHNLSVMVSDRTYHWRYCQNPGCKYVETAYHEFSNWRVARAATEEKDGLLRKDCAYCTQKLWSSYAYSDNPRTVDPVFVPMAMMLLTAGALPVVLRYTKRKWKYWV